MFVCVRVCVFVSERVCVCVCVSVCVFVCVYAPANILQNNFSGYIDSVCFACFCPQMKE